MQPLPHLSVAFVDLVDLSVYCCPLSVTKFQQLQDFDNGSFNNIL